MSDPDGKIPITCRALSRQHDPAGRPTEALSYSSPRVGPNANQEDQRDQRCEDNQTTSRSSDGSTLQC